jgi:exosome complex exonuclease DIS3/RRP44
MKGRRMDAGVLKLSSPQLHFILDCETKEPLGSELYEHHEVNSFLEEFMPFTNIEVAKRLYEVFPQSAMLRRQELPPAGRFESLEGKASTWIETEAIHYYESRKLIASWFD